MTRCPLPQSGGANVAHARRHARRNTAHRQRELGKGGGGAGRGQGQKGTGAPQEEDGSSFSRAFFCFSVAAARASASFSSGIMLSTLRANRSWYLAVLMKALLRKLGKPPTRSFWVYRGTRTSPSTCGQETRVGTRSLGTAGPLQEELVSH